MTTPTREQVIEQAIQGHASTRMAMQWLYEHALKEGRDQGLREAKEVPKREFCEWQKLPTNSLDVMKELGNFGPTVNAMQREVKGYMLDDEGDGVSRYWTSDDLRNIANGCNEVADWLDQRAAIEQLRGK